jgi:anti-anti-sigma regulatory factor
MASPWLLVISKRPEYGPTGEVVPGQCEPYTSGWRLRLYSDGVDQVLLTGTYYELRRIQKECMGRERGEVEKIAAEARQRMAVGADETAIVKGVGGNGSHIEYPESELDTLPSEEETDAFSLAAVAENGAFETNSDDEVLVARVKDPGVLHRGNELEQDLHLLLKASRGALVLDIRAVAELSLDAANILGRFTFHAEQEGGFVALANVSNEVVNTLQGMEIEGTLVAYVDLASAVDEAQAFMERQV